MSRWEADVALQEFVQRVRLLNEGVPELNCRVTRVSVFGSYITDRGDVGDIDIFYSMVELPAASGVKPAGEVVTPCKEFVPPCCPDMSHEEFQTRLYLVAGSRRYHLFNFEKIEGTMRNWPQYIVFVDSSLKIGAERGGGEEGECLN